jgi:hypothetical protein
MRGEFNSVAEQAAYAGADKLWYVGLQQSDCYWMDLIVDPPSGCSAPRWIKEQLGDLKRRVEASLAKRFVYMYGSRTKVRFDERAPVSTSFFSRQTMLNLRVGREGRRVSFPWDVSLAPELVGLDVSATPKFITFCGQHRTSTFSVHDFLRLFHVDLGGSTTIHYVGATKNPETRPLERQHRGYADMLYGVGVDDCDFFLFMSLFKVLSVSAQTGHGVRFMLANAMTDEVPVREEGALIEHALIAYFDSRFQDEAHGGERARLRSELRRISEKKNIRGVIVDFELDEPCPYFRFSSDVRAASDRHVFRVSLESDNLEVEELPRSFEFSDDVFACRSAVHASTPNGAP